MTGEFFWGCATAAWLGFLCSISPCPLATNIAAISFVGRKVGKIGAVLGAGALYTLGRTLTYAILGMLLISGLTAAPGLSHLLQKYMNLLMGPLLILVALVLLDLLKFGMNSGGGIGAAAGRCAEQCGLSGALMLGVIFALSFCPTSAALFFGSLLPLAVKAESRIALPVIFGIATGLPVLWFAFLLAFGANRIGRMYHRVAEFEVWAQRVTGLIFLIVGLYLTVTVTLAR